MKLIDENGRRVHLNELVAVSEDMELQDHFVVKVVKDELPVGYKEYDAFPTDEQLIWCIYHFIGDGAYIQRKYVLGRTKRHGDI